MTRNKRNPSRSLSSIRPCVGKSRGLNFQLLFQWLNGIVIGIFLTSALIPTFWLSFQQANSQKNVTFACFSPDLFFHIEFVGGKRCNFHQTSVKFLIHTILIVLFMVGSEAIAITSTCQILPKFDLLKYRLRWTTGEAVGNLSYELSTRFKLSIVVSCVQNGHGLFRNRSHWRHGTDSQNPSIGPTRSHE